MYPPETWVSFPALGSQAIVAVCAREQLAAARAVVERTVAEFDLACSRFRADSELSALNAAGGAAMRVSPLLLDAVTAALRAAQLTDGDVDPTVGRALIALGYDRDFAALAGERPPRVSFVSAPGWQAVELDSAAGTIRLPSGVSLDLGATAKALAADRAAAAACAAIGGGVLVSLGGDLALAGEAPEGGWRVRVTDDHRAPVSAPGQWISLVGGGLATSSTAARRWATSEGTAHHLVDPATGANPDGFWRTVSVAAGSCLDANIASTAAIVRGERASAWLTELALPSRLVSEQGRVCHLAGWPAQGDDLSLLAPSAATVIAR